VRLNHLGKKKEKDRRRKEKGGRTDVLQQANDPTFPREKERCALISEEKRRVVGAIHRK